MPLDIYRAIAKIGDAGFAQEAWPEALKSMTDALGVAGAASIVFNKKSGRVDWICVSGLSAELKSAYINHYAPLDPFAPLLNGALDWMKLSESLSEPLLRRSEWYNDFVLACGVRDILGARLLDTQSHFVIFGLHQRIGRGFGDKIPLILNAMEQPLVSATLNLRHVENLFAAPTDGAGMQIALEGTRYYFHVSNGRNYPDETGSVFPTNEDAVAHARRLAAELEQDLDWGSFVVSVTDVDGREVAQILLRPQGNSAGKTF